eukprot:TRINITY_DN21306_c0_g1_i1.p1 TRINITY_DN21306_c0_g1~~TRINITY_DN21306_c0_g1_i1.p1  ORF type:complete len:360 (+),score=89.98 TRINITY_DN21306_c0_g1_i1:60-1082(+)
MMPADRFYTNLPQATVTVGVSGSLSEVHRVDEERKKMEEVMKEKEFETEDKKKSYRECLSKLEVLKSSVDSSVKREQEALAKVDEIKAAAEAIQGQLEDAGREAASSEARRKGLLSNVERAARETKEAQERERKLRDDLLKEEAALQQIRSKVLSIRQDASQRKRWQDMADLELQRAKGEVTRTILLHSEQLKNLQESEFELSQTQQAQDKWTSDLDDVKKRQAVVRMNFVGSQKHDAKQIATSVLKSCNDARSGIAGLTIGSTSNITADIISTNRLDQSLLELKADSTEQMRRIAADRLDTLRRTIDFTYSYEPASAIPAPTSIPAAAKGTLSNITSLG